MSYNLVEVDFNVLKGKIIEDVTYIEEESAIYFTTSKNKQYVLMHIDECCEDVDLVDIVGDLYSLVGNKIYLAEKISNSESKPLGRLQTTYTWTYFKLASRGGYVTLSYYGTSNGHYTEDAKLYKIV